MRVEVRGHGVEVSEALREHVERRLAFALDRFRERVESAYAILRDVNGSARHGVDKECRVALVLRTSGSVAAQARRADLYRLFIDTLRANLPENGMLRLHHVMGLFRLYWIPPGR